MKTLIAIMIMAVFMGCYQPGPPTPEEGQIWCFERMEFNGKRSSPFECDDPEPQYGYICQYILEVRGDWYRYDFVNLDDPEPDYQKCLTDETKDLKYKDFMMDLDKDWEYRVMWVESDYAKNGPIKKEGCE